MPLPFLAMLAAASLQQGPGKEPGYVDAHIHVWTDDLVRYPLGVGWTKAEMKPSRFTPDDFFRHARPNGVRRAVLVQMSYYYPHERAPLDPKTAESDKGKRVFDNSYMLDVIAKHPGVFVGTAVIDPLGKDPAGEMAALAKKGVRAFRIYPKLTKEPIDRWLRPEGYAKMFAEGARNKQALACLINPDALPELDRMCTAHPETPVIIDHLARIGVDGSIRAADIERLCRMARHKKVMVKVGAFYALGKKAPPYDDLAPLIKQVVAAFGADRCMWESDCPFQVQGENSYQASIDLVRRRLDFLSAAEREWLLRKTAERFFFAK